MGLQAKAGFIGLVTATGEVGAPQGALRKADNVTLRRSGALERRQNWTQSNPLTRAYSAHFWYQQTKYQLDKNNIAYRADTALIVPTFPSPAPTGGVRADCFSVRESRNNLYFAAKRGIAKVTSSANTSLFNTGLSPSDVGVGQTLLATTGATILPNNSQVAYRIVGKHVDANGLIVRSRPSGAVIIANTTGAARSPQLLLTIDTIRAVNTISEVEVYRTRTFPTSATPDDEMQLVASLKSSLFPSGTYMWTDEVVDSARTTTLYTSPSRGGIENASDRPPGAAVIELFRGHLFFGNLTGPQIFVVSFKFSSTNLVGVATGIGIRTVTGNISSGSTSITSVSNMAGLQLGMVVGGTLSPGTAYVTAIAGTTVTVSSPSGITATGSTMTFTDALILDGIPVALGRNSTFAANLQAANMTSTYAAYEITPASPGYDVTLVVESKARGAPTFLATATHGGEMSPPLGVWGGTGTASKGDALVHGLAWSEPDEPEHVPPKNYARVGDGSKAILGLTAMKDALLIWKEDGLFRLTGAVASGFRIDPFDPTVVCILPGSIRRLRDCVYALTTLGIAEVSDTATNVISAPIGPDLAKHVVERIRREHYFSGIYRPVVTDPCICASADEGNGEYWLFTGPTWESNIGGQILVFSVERQGFTTNTFGDYPSTICALSQNPTGQPAYLIPTALYEPDTNTSIHSGNIVARVQPHGFCESGLLGKLWTHVVVGFSTLGNASSVQVTYSSSETQVLDSVTENFDLPTLGGNVVFPEGGLLRHIVPTKMRRAWKLRVEIIINTVASTFILDAVGAESRDNIPNKDQTVANGST